MQGEPSPTFFRPVNCHEPRRRSLPESAEFESRTFPVGVIIVWRRHGGRHEGTVLFRVATGVPTQPRVAPARSHGIAVTGSAVRARICSRSFAGCVRGSAFI